MIPIIMCTWMRPDGFANVIDDLNNQQNSGFKLFVWNNNYEYSGRFEAIAKRAEFEVEFYHSRENIGGFGRFYSAKSLFEKPGIEEYCIFLDDDNRLAPDALQTLCDEARDHSISATYGWVFNSQIYFDRYQPDPGMAIDYAGTAGMIAHMGMFKSEVLYQCPQEYWFVEDLWMSYVARNHCGYEMYKSAANVTLDMHDASLSDATAELKLRMLAAMVGNMNFKIGGKKP